MKKWAILHSSTLTARLLMDREYISFTHDYVFLIYEHVCVGTILVVRFDRISNASIHPSLISSIQHTKYIHTRIELSAPQTSTIKSLSKP